MADRNIGIGDISLFVPKPFMSLETLVEYRIKQDPSLERRLRRSIDVTGQVGIRFPELWQDNTTLAAQAAAELLRRNDAAATAGMRYLVAGTETTVDHSKPIAAYVEGMLQRSGIDVPTTISTFQVQHACAGGTISMLSIGALLQAAGRDGETGVILSTDIARYTAPSTAEITQGAGAVAMLVERNPRLLSLDLSSIGYCSNDVDDFFRPLGSVTAKVKGGYSVQCYHNSLDGALTDHAERLGSTPKEVLESVDMFVLHVPFRNMAYNALARVVTKQLGLEGEELDTFLHDRGFPQSLEAATQIGNIYSGSAYMALSFLLAERHNTLGQDIVGKKILFASYGSGNTMMVFQGTVEARAPEVISSWDISGIPSAGRDATFDEYERWIRGPESNEAYRGEVESSDIGDGSYYLAGIRDDGYREYSYR